MPMHTDDLSGPQMALFVAVKGLMSQFAGNEAVAHMFEVNFEQMKAILEATPTTSDRKLHAYEQAVEGLMDAVRPPAQPG